MNGTVGDGETLHPADRRQTISLHYADRIKRGDNICWKIGMKVWAPIAFDGNKFTTDVLNGSEKLENNAV